MLGGRLRRDLRAAIAGADDGLAAALAGQPASLAPGSGRTAWEHQAGQLAGEPTVYRQLASDYAAAGDPAATECALESVHDGGSFPAGLDHRHDPTILVALDPDRPLSDRYQALRAVENERRPGDLVALWRMLLAETGDQEEATRLRERLLLRLARSTPSAADLPIAARRGIAREVQDAVADLANWLNDQIDLLANAGGEELQQIAVDARGELAAALQAEELAEAAAQQARRRVDQAWRSAADDRVELALGRLAGWLPMVVAQQRLNPRFDATSLLDDAEREILATAEDLWPARSLPLARLAEAWAAVGDLPRAVALADTRIDSWLRRTEALAAIAQLADLGTPSATAGWLAELATAERPGEVTDYLSCAVAPRLAALGQVSEALGLAERIEGPAARALLHCDLARFVADTSVDFAMELWSLAMDRPDVAASVPWVATEQLATSVEILAGRTEPPWEGHDWSRDCHPHPAVAGAVGARQVAALAIAGGPWMSLAVERLCLVRGLPFDCLALATVGAARLTDGDSRGAVDLMLAYQRAGHDHPLWRVPARSPWVPMQLWCDAARLVPPAHFASLLAAVWPRYEPVPVEQVEPLLGLMTRRLRDQINAVFHRRAAAYREQLRQRIDQLGRTAGP